MKLMKSLPVAIIGAGPAGLAAAAQLTLQNQPFFLFEAGKQVASNILSWEHVRVFSPWRYNIDKAARQLLEASSWKAPQQEALPTGRELYEQYFKPFAELAAIKPHILLEHKVLAIGRKNMDKVKSHGRAEVPYVVQVLEAGESIKQYEVKAVIDASGTWNSPNPIGSGGAFAVGEVENRDRIFYGIPDVTGKQATRYKNRSVLVVGSGHSALNALLELAKLKEQYPDTQIHWVMRKKRMQDVYGGQEKDALPAREALGTKIEQLVKEGKVNVYTPFRVQHIIRENEQLSIVGFQGDEQRVLPGIEEIISNTGSRPDFSFLREVRLQVDPALESAAAIAELIDPNIHSCGTVRPHGERELRHPDKDFYIVGSKSYGRAPTFLMATGYEQVRSVVAALMGDQAAADKVELELPETGVCSLNIPALEEKENAACCGRASESKEQLAPACCG